LQACRTTEGKGWSLRLRLLGKDLATRDRS
jgi:hypothetical protein